MKKTLLSGLLAAALLSLTLPSCSSSENSGENTPTAVLPDLPAAPDTTGGKKLPEQYRELNAVNATEDIKKMQPQM